MMKVFWFTFDFGQVLKFILRKISDWHLGPSNHCIDFLMVLVSFLLLFITDYLAVLDSLAQILHLFVWTIGELLSSWDFDFVGSRSITHYVIEADPHLSELSHLQQHNDLIITCTSLLDLIPEIEKLVTLKRPTLFIIQSSKEIKRWDTGLQVVPMIDKTFFVNFVVFIGTKQVEDLVSFINALLRKLGVQCPHFLLYVELLNDAV